MARQGHVTSRKAMECVDIETLLQKILLTGHLEAKMSMAIACQKLITPLKCQLEKVREKLLKKLYVKTQSCHQ